MRKQVKVSLDLSDLEALEGLSKEMGRSLSTMIREAVKKWLKEEVEARQP